MLQQTPRTHTTRTQAREAFDIHINTFSVILHSLGYNQVFRAVSQPPTSVPILHHNPHSVLHLYSAENSEDESGSPANCTS